MNKAYAFFCRAYQTVFRAALPILPYREPVQLDGLASIVPLLTEKEISSVLLVMDASVRALGLTGGLEDALKAASSPAPSTTRPCRTPPSRTSRKGARSTFPRMRRRSSRSAAAR